MERTPILIKSERLFLTPLHLSHVPDFTRWFNDPDVFGLMRDMNYHSSESEQSRWVFESRADPNQKICSIFYSEENRLIGNGGFINIRHEDRKAEIGLIIGEKSLWNRGLGQEAIWLLCRYGFERLHLHNILAEHYAVNTKSVHVFEKVGFRAIGTRRESRFLGGKMIDVHYSDLLLQDLRKPSRSGVNQ